MALSKKQLIYLRRVRKARQAMENERQHRARQKQHPELSK